MSIRINYYSELPKLKCEEFEPKNKIYYWTKDDNYIFPPKLKRRIFQLRQTPQRKKRLAARGEVDDELIQVYDL